MDRIKCSYSLIIKCFLTILFSTLLLNVHSLSNNLDTESELKDNKETCDADRTEDNDQCRIYLAESSIPNTGLGIYSAFEIKENETLASEISIPLCDVGSTILDHYYWDSLYRGQFLEAHTCKSIVPGLGMAANSARGLANVLLTEPGKMGKVPEDEKVLLGHGGPDIGSYSDYALHQWHATKDIPMGMEIFAEYGDNYFNGRTGYETIPMSKNYVEADTIIRDFLKELENKPDLTPSESQDLWRWKLSSLGTRTFNALPKKVDLLSKAIEKGTATYALPNAIRSRDWLKDNGQCMDNIISKKTTLSSHKGRGAFAKRFIPKNSIVSPAPLLHFKNSSVFDMVDVDFDPRVSKNVTKKNYTDFVPQQLFVNYCFGHPDSSMLLFPYSSRVQFINHDRKHYNAKLRWSTSNLHQPSWLNQPLSDLSDTTQGLIIDIVATRDIHEGEEIFLDYGEDWQNAYADHVLNWKKSPDHESFMHSEEMNEDESFNSIKTKIEQIADPYPPNVQTVCSYEHPKMHDKSVHQGTVELDYYHDQLQLILGNLLPCDVLERSTCSDAGNEVYHVRVFPLGHSKLAFPVVLKNVSRNSLMFAPRLYTATMFEKKAFRHFIEIPNEIFPESWKNLKKQ